MGEITRFSYLPDLSRALLTAEMPREITQGCGVFPVSLVVQLRWSSTPLLVISLPPWVAGLQTHLTRGIFTALIGERHDPARLDISEVAGGEVVVGVVVEDHQTGERGCAADEKVDDGQGTGCTRAGKPMLSGVDPAPHRLGHRHIGIQLGEHSVHLVELVGVAG